MAMSEVTVPHMRNLSCWRSVTINILFCPVKTYKNFQHFWTNSRGHRQSSTLQKINLNKIWRNGLLLSSQTYIFCSISWWHMSTGQKLKYTKHQQNLAHTSNIQRKTSINSRRQFLTELFCRRTHKSLTISLSFQTCLQLIPDQNSPTSFFKLVCFQSGKSMNSLRDIPISSCTKHTN